MSIGRKCGIVQAPLLRFTLRQFIHRLGTAAGCTACAAVVRRGVLTVANAGDSRCVLSRGGSAVEMSYDHKPDLPKEMARIEVVRS